MTVPLTSDRAEAPLFTDGLGERVVAVDGATGDLLQILRLRPALLAVPSFEFALRERTARLANFRHAYYARVRRVDRHPAGLAIVADHVEGTRLSEILRVAAERGLNLDINAALCLIRQLVPAIALLHENARDVAHGLLAPERLIVTPHARLVIAEHVLGSAVEQLQFGRERLWQELRIAVPQTAGAPRFDHRADVMGLGLISLALMLGRPLRADEFPHRLPMLLHEVRAKSTLGEEQPLPPSLRGWLAGALQLDLRRAFASATEALSALEDVLSDDSGFVAAPVALETFLSRYVAALLEPPAPPAASPAPTPAPVAKAEFLETPSPVLAATSAVPTPAVPPQATARTQTPPPPAPTVPTPRQAAPAPTVPTPRRAAPAPTVPTPRQAAPAPAMPTPRQAAPAPTVITPRPPTPAPTVVTPRVDRTPAPMATPASAPVITPIAAPVSEPAPPARDLRELLDDFDGITPADRERDQLFNGDRTSTDKRDPAPAAAAAGKKRGRGRLLALAVLLLAVAGGGWYYVRVWQQPGAAAPSTGTLSVQTNPPGVQVFVDGVAHGLTPARLSLSGGSHIVELRGRGVPRVIPITVTPGAEVSQYLEMPQTPTTGSLLVQSTPPGAKVTIDGVERGVAPVSVADLEAGEHEVVLQGAGEPVTQRVVIQPGVTASVLAPVATEAPGPVSGWLTFKSPVTIEIHENGRLLGTTNADRIMMAAGRHQLELVNETLGYSATRTVVVPPGKVLPLSVDLPQGIVNLNASPWAEVWIDGVRVGETPIGNLAVTIGPHEIVFRNPQFGEKREAVSVTTKAPVRLSVDMK